MSSKQKNGGKAKANPKKFLSFVLASGIILIAVIYLLMMRLSADQAQVGEKIPACDAQQKSFSINYSKINSKKYPLDKVKIELCTKSPNVTSWKEKEKCYLTTLKDNLQFSVKAVPYIPKYGRYAGQDINYSKYYFFHPSDGNPITAIRLTYVDGDKVKPLIKRRLPFPLYSGKNGNSKVCERITTKLQKFYKGKTIIAN